MPGLVAVVAGVVPRLSMFLIWLARPALFSAAFGGAWLWPLLGILLLPLTTLLYALLWTPEVGLVGWDWLWLGLAVALDVVSTVVAGYGYREHALRVRRR